MSLCHSDAGCRDALSELAFPPQVSGLFMVDICCWELVVCQGMHVGSPQYVEENAEKKGDESSAPVANPRNKRKTRLAS